MCTRTTGEAHLPYFQVSETQSALLPKKGEKRSVSTQDQKNNSGHAENVHISAMNITKQF